MVNGISNGANTNILTLMDIDIEAPIAYLEFENFGSGYSIAPTISIVGGELSPADIDVSIDSEGIITSYTINDSGLYNWTMRKCIEDNNSPELIFSPSPSGSQYTARAFAYPNSGYSQNPIVDKEYFVRGVRSGDENAND